MTIQICMGGYGPPTTTHSRALKLIGDRLTAQFGNDVDIKYVWNVMDFGYKGEPLDSERGPGLGCFRFQVGLLGFGDKRPWQLSGGMLQRASLCRALIHEPQLLLLDEPFGALDQFTREELWDIMQTLWIARRPTVLMVTHDLRESAYLATRICVMSSRPGRILEDREVPFARPRTLEMSYSPEFATLVQQLRMRIAQARTDGDAAVPEVLLATQPEPTGRMAA